MTLPPTKDNMMRAVGTHGFVRLVDMMPWKDADRAIVDAARVSYGGGTQSFRNDRGLIRYLMRHRHTTPFEMVELKFHMKMPLFVARQHMRHRTASINEISARYSQLPDEFFELNVLRSQSTTNKQGSSHDLITNKHLTEKHKDQCEKAFAVYQELLDAGVARELARTVLPVGTYTEFYWKVNLHNFLHYSSLRTDNHAQEEIRMFASAMVDLVAPFIPFTFEAYEDYVVKAVTFSGPDLLRLRNRIQGKEETNYASKGENDEFDAKISNLFADS